MAGNLARSKARPRVLLIELGEDNAQAHLRIPSERFINPYKNPNIALGYRTAPQEYLNGRVLDYLRGKGLGGSSIANFLAYIRGTASDYNRWAALVDDDKFRWSRVMEHYKEIENLHFDDDEDDEDGYVKLKDGAHGFGGRVDLTLPSRRHWPEGLDNIMKAALDHGWPLNPDQNSGDVTGIGSVTTTTYGGYRVTSASAYLTNPPPNLVLWISSTVARVLFAKNELTSKPRAVGLLLADGRRVRASKEVILSLGTIDTPKLLMLSGIGSRDELQRLGIPCLVHSPRIGKDMIDHNYVVLTWASTANFGSRVPLKPDNTKEHDAKVMSARERWLHDRSGPDATLNTVNLIGFLKFDPERVSFDELHKLDSDTRSHIEQPDVPQFELFLQGYVPDDWDTGRGACLGMGVMLMNPQSRGTVTLSSKDPAAMPIIDVNFLSHPYDCQTLVNGVKEALIFCKSKEMSPHVVASVVGPQSESDEDVLKFCQDTLMSVLHGVGTVMMGRKDDETAPADTDFRVRGVEGLRVMDLSVCPMITK